MLKVTGRAMAGALSLLPVAASAAASDEVEEAGAPLNRDELSLYAAPRQASRYVEPEAGQLEQSVATFRKLAEPYTARCQGTLGQIRPKLQRAIQFGGDAYAYLKNPPPEFHSRAVVIGFTGVLGLIMARGSRIKRLIYPAGVMTVSTSVYYPEQASAVIKSTGDSVYESAVQSYATLEKLLRPQSGSKTGADSETRP